MIIYKITNDINDKVYIGQTIQPLRRRWQRHLHDARNGSQYAIHKAIMKYGESHFHIVEIDHAATREELDKKEQFWITKYNSMSPNGYNLCAGGKTPRWTDEIRNKVSGDNHWTKRQSFSEESLLKKHEALYRKPSGRSKKVRCVETGEICDCAKEFEYKYGHHLSKILDCCKGRRKSHHNLHWEYVDVEVVKWLK